MQKNGVNNLFIREVSDKIKKLRVNSSLIDPDLIEKLDTNLKKLEDVVKVSGVPPPSDTPVFSQDHLEKVSDLIESDESLDLESIRRINQEIKTDVIGQLEDFKSAKIQQRKAEKSFNLESIQSFLHNDFTCLDTVFSQNQSNFHTYSEMIYNKEVENNYLKAKIYEIEDALRNKKEQQCEICKCVVF